MAKKIIYTKKKKIEDTSETILRDSFFVVCFEKRKENFGATATMSKN